MPPRKEPGTTKQKYSAIACNPCRKRKVKCDEKRPKCSNCEVYQLNCVLGEDRRRTSSTINVINFLNSRIEGLEGQLAESIQSQTEKNLTDVNATQKTAAPPTSGRRESPIPDAVGINEPPLVCTALNTSNMDFWTSVNGEGFFDMQEGSPVNVMDHFENDTALRFDETFEDDAIMVSNANLPNKQAPPTASLLNCDIQDQVHLDTMIFDPTMVHQNDYPCLPFLSEDDCEHELTQRLTSRMGQLKIAEDGQLRYYGVTSNLHMTNDGLLSLFQPTIRHSRIHGENYIRQLDLQWPGDPEYETHLLNLFFAWHNPFLQEVRRDVFEREKQIYISGQETPLYSSALENAMLAVGALYSSIEYALGEDGPSEFFATRARVYLEIEMDSPTLATAQTVIILCGFEAAHGRDSRGWMYIGMAAQIATDLGLHQNIEPSQQYMNTVTDAKSVVSMRRHLFWACYSADAYWSCYSGRPSLMFNMKYTVPSASASTDYQWRPYISRDEDVHQPQGTDTRVLQQIPPYVAQLGMKVGRIGEALYAGNPEPKPGIVDFVTGMSLELKQWKDTLPPELNIDLSQGEPLNRGKLCLPMLVQFNMQYHATMILLHRPFVKEASSPSASDAKPSDASGICSYSATQISRLLVTYRKHLSWRYLHLQSVHIATIAGVVHAYDTCVFPGPRAKFAQEQLLVCVQALGELAQSYKSSTRGLEVIAAVRREWQNQRFLHAGTKRGRLPSFNTQSDRLGGRRKSSGAFDHRRMER